ncbi:MAG: chorismate synthase [Bradymonadia bacterium]
MSSTTGLLFRVTTFGESHGPALGCVVDGCPAGLDLDLDAVQAELDRRRPGQSALTTPRAEADRLEVLSGLFEGRTTGAPLTLIVRNTDADSSAYAPTKDVLRPGHADWTWSEKYGHRDWRGGGRASARETVARVAAAAVARQFLAREAGIEVVAWVDRVADESAEVEVETVTRAQVDAHAVRCPERAAAARMAAVIEAAKQAGDTVGGTVACVARGVPLGYGEPIFDKLHADLGHACLSLPACKGFEVGSGFAGTRLSGSAHNDPLAWDADAGRVRATKNDAGGVLGGLSNGEPLVLRCAFKPVSTHFQPQTTVTRTGEPTSLTNRGRHDPCVLPRAVPLVEAAVLLTLADHALRLRAAAPFRG